MDASFIFTIGYMVAFGAWGAYLAKNRERSQAGWFVICALFGLVGIVVIALMKSPKAVARPTSTTSQKSSGTQPTRSSTPKSPQALVAPVSREELNQRLTQKIAYRQVLPADGSVFEPEALVEEIQDWFFGLADSDRSPQPRSAGHPLDTVERLMQLLGSQDPKEWGKEYADPKHIGRSVEVVLTSLRYWSAKANAPMPWNTAVVIQLRWAHEFELWCKSGDFRRERRSGPRDERALSDAMKQGQEYLLLLIRFSKQINVKCTLEGHEATPRQIAAELAAFHVECNRVRPFDEAKAQQGLHPSATIRSAASLLDNDFDWGHLAADPKSMGRISATTLRNLTYWADTLRVPKPEHVGAAIAERWAIEWKAWITSPEYLEDEGQRA